MKSLKPASQLDTDMDGEEQKRAKALEALHEFGQEFQRAMDEIKEHQEEYWNSLTKEQQLDVFCCVSRRILEGEIVKKGSYRYVLYETFGFGPEAYATALDAGYLTIHNSFVDQDHDFQLLKRFCEVHGIDSSDKKIIDFLA